MLRSQSNIYRRSHIDENSAAAMEEIKSERMTMFGRLETEVEIKVELKEEFYAATDGIDSEEIATVDTESAILPDKYEVQRPELGSQYYEVTLPLGGNIRSLLRCRLCAIPNNDLVDIFSYHKTDNYIVERIEYCLRIVVKETDTLPKQACRSCLHELELCYQFNKTVAEAEKQLLALDSQTSGELEQMERNRQTSSLPNVHCGTMDHYNVDRILQISSGIESQNSQLGKKTLDKELVTDTTVESNPVSAGFKPTSGVLVPVENHYTDDLDEVRGLSSGYNEQQNVDLSMDDFYSRRTLTCDDLQTTCDSGVPRATHSRSRVNKKQMSSLRCEEGLDNRGNLADHEQAQTEGSFYRCNLCAKTFKTFNSRRTHDKLHTGKGLHSCEYCEKKFTSRADKNRHHRIHTGERPFKCSVCEMTFIESTKLRRHAAVHSEKRNFPCSLCNKSFKHMSSRKLHMEVHVGEIPWQCDYCKKNYKRKQILRRHVKTCKKGYRTNYHYTRKNPFQIEGIQESLIANK